MKAALFNRKFECGTRTSFPLACRERSRDGTTMTPNDPPPESPVPASPGWIDADLSAELEAIAAASESASVEFKADMPPHAGGLAKEMAAFATSGTGQIFLGITDEGEIIGFPGINTVEGRLALRSRIEGVAAAVKPVIQPVISYAVSGSGEDRRIVAAILVPKGEAPIYYAGNIGYLRQMSVSRPLTPDEVIERVRAWDKASKPTAESRYLGELAGLLLGVDVMLHDYRARSPRRGIGDLKAGASHFAEAARRVGASAPQSHAETEPLLDTLADELVTIASARSMIGTPRVDLLGAIDEVDRMVRQMRARWVPPETFGDATREEARETVRTAAKQLAGLAARLVARRPDTRIQDAPTEVAARGYEILRYASLGVGLGDEARVAELLDQAVVLRSFGTRQIYQDGGESRRQLIEDIGAASARLDAWVAALA